MLLILPTLAKASVQVTSEETLMLAQAEELPQLAALFGSDPSATLQFGFAIDPISGGFSYTTLAGQTYDGQSYSMGVSATYDPASTTYNWSGSGLLGSVGLTEQGNAAWTGDCCVNFAANGTLETSQVIAAMSIKGSLTTDADGTEIDTGSAIETITFTNNTTAEVYFEITSTLPKGTSGTWNITYTPTTQDGVVTGTPNQGTFSLGENGTITEYVPEPGTIFLFGGAISMLLLVRPPRMMKVLSVRQDRT